MKRGTYNLTHPSPHENERPDLYRDAIKYSSWKISHSVYMSAKLLYDNERWENVRSLTIHQFHPLTREFYRWAWETIETRCSNLLELTLIFEGDSESNLDTEVESDYQLAVQGLPNVSFPNISNLKSLASVHFKGIYDKTTAYFAENLLQATTTSSLRHLHFCPIVEPVDEYIEEEPFRIFNYLKQNPALLSNLQSFSFNLGWGSYYANGNDDVGACFSINSEESVFTKFIKEKDASLPFQFSGNLQSLFWDLAFHLGGQLLPGVLTPSIASSLVQLSLKFRVESLEEAANNWFSRNKLSFPNFPRLRALKLGFFAGQSLFVEDLVDCSPNLYVFEAIAPTIFIDQMLSFWRGSDKESVSKPKQHSQLRIFCTDIPFQDGLSTLQKILSKFPHLVELRLGSVVEVGLDQFLSLVQSTHPKLQRLSWKASDKFTLEELFRHLIRLPGQLPTLNSYSLGWQGRNFRPCEVVQWPDSIQDMETVANILLSLPSKSDSSLVINLLLKSLSCPCIPIEESASKYCKQCYLHEIIRRHNLPIRIPSEREIEEMKKKYKWDHRFASNWIYK
jgi:hypothetical protein